MPIANKHMSYWFWEPLIEEKYDLRKPSLEEAKAGGTDLNVAKTPVRRFEKRQYIMKRIYNCSNLVNGSQSFQILKIETIFLMER
jgi:hypothetical protein